MKFFFLFLTLLVGAPALADHSLSVAMEDSAELSRAVNLTMKANDVVCDLSNSNQSYVFASQVGDLGTAWKQIALCFKNKADMIAAQEAFASGAGFYSAPGIVGVLVAKYTWENYATGKVISVTYQ